MSGSILPSSASLLRLLAYFSSALLPSASVAVAAGAAPSSYDSLRSSAIFDMPCET